MKQGFLQKVIVFLLIYIVISYLINIFIGEKPGDSISGDVVVTVEKEIGQGTMVTANVSNRTDKDLMIPNDCPGEPLDVWAYKDSAWVLIDAQPKIDCSKLSDYVVPAQSDIDVPYTFWSNALFGQKGRYKIAASVEVDGEVKSFESNEFEIVSPSLFRSAWNKFLYQPIFNALIFLTRVMPGFSLGLAIIMLTILMRTILLIPSHKAMRAQKRMQEIQPKLEAIREKYKGNQEKIAQETMKIWKTQNVNPFGSCLPLLIQFPILIALFYVVQSGLNPDQAALLYGPLRDFSFDQIHTNFLGILELTEIESFVLPLIVGLLQFSQMKMAIMRRDKKSVNKDKKGKKSEMEIANNMMIYFLPVMIAMFTASVPAGVGLYWGISTVYGMVQQFVINRESNDEPKVKVIN